jgi:Sec-independent protein translocase protein TatA
MRREAVGVPGPSLMLPTAPLAPSKLRGARSDIAAFALPHYDEAMSFSETIFLFFLALIIFGPKKLPEIARQAGRLLAELRRASNEFKSQIETEIAHLEVEKTPTVLAPNPPVAGTVASEAPNLATGSPVSPQLESSVSSASPTPEAASADSSLTSSPDTAPEVVGEPTVPASQESHV